MMIDRCCFHVVRVALIFCGDPIGGGELWPLGPGGHWECACGPRQCQSAGCFGRRGHATGRPGCPRESGAAWSASRPGGDPGVCLSSRVARRASTGYGYGSRCPWTPHPCCSAPRAAVAPTAVRVRPRSGRGIVACGVLFLGRVRRGTRRKRSTHVARDRGRFARGGCLVLRVNFPLDRIMKSQEKDQALEVERPSSVACQSESP